VEQVSVDLLETGGAPPPPTAEFDPGRRVVPLPNALLMDPATGRVNLPEQCGEEPGSVAAQLRASLNQLDGFGTSKANIVATFSEPVDPASLEGRVFLVRLAERGVPLQAVEGPVAVAVGPGISRRFTPDCGASVQVSNVTLRPAEPLLGASTYAVVLLAGIRAQSGLPFEPSATWALVRQAEAPVQFSDAGSTEEGLIQINATPFDPADPAGFASLQGLDRLWRAHAPLLAAVDQLAPALVSDRAIAREDVLLAWAFDTQTLDAVFDPTVPDSPAALLGSVPDALDMPAAAAGEDAPLAIEEFFAAALPGVPCSTLGCDAIGWIYAATPLSQAPAFVAPSFQSGDDCDFTSAPQPGAFTDAMKPSKSCDQAIPLIAVVPREPPGPDGYATVVFAHGLGRSKEDLLALAGALARGGIASVAFDAVDHGARALQISTEAALGCDGPGAGKPCSERFGPSCAPQCFAPMFSANLPLTRDHLRQTVLDQLKLERVLEACADPDACGRLQVDPGRIGYVGQSLGALIGGVSVAVSRSMPAAVLNVGAGDWVQVLTESATPGIRCPLVDALIGSGVLGGEPWDGGASSNATCLGEGWRSEPAFLEFAATARWILDPADPVNYARRYGAVGSPRVLVAEVVDDPVVPNSATATFASLLGLQPEPAGTAVSAMPEPSPAALQPGSLWIRYQSLGADASSMFPGNAYDHGSLLAPAELGPETAPESGALGTLQMQIDTLTYLLSHL
jgi:hypothetical protein